MDIKNVLESKGIKVENGKISKADLNKALEAIASVNGIKNTSIEIVDGSKIQVEYKVDLNLSKSFKENAKGKTGEDLHELYENLDYVGEEFDKEGLDNKIWDEYRNNDGILKISGTTATLNYWPSSLPKVEEGATIEEMAKNLESVSAEVVVELFFTLDVSEIAEKCMDLANKALKESKV